MERDRINTYRLLRSRDMSRNQASKATGLTYKRATMLDVAERAGRLQPPVSDLADLMREDSE